MFLQVSHRIRAIIISSCGYGPVVSCGHIYKWRAKTHIWSERTRGESLVTSLGTMTGFAVGTPAVVVICGTVLLLAGDPLGRDLITLAVGMYIGEK